MRETAERLGQEKEAGIVCRELGVDSTVGKIINCNIPIQPHPTFPLLQIKKLLNKIQQLSIINYQL